MIGHYRAADAGTYTCLASNDAGNASVDLHLTVHGLFTVMYLYVLLYVGK